jgi:hypothetical protein
MIEAQRKKRVRLRNEGEVRHCIEAPLAMDEARIA